MRGWPHNPEVAGFNPARDLNLLPWGYERAWSAGIVHLQ